MVAPSVNLAWRCRSHHGVPLPTLAYREVEVTSEVIDGPRSVIYHQASNRLHAQKALLLFLSGVQV